MSHHKLYTSQLDDIDIDIDEGEFMRFCFLILHYILFIVFFIFPTIVFAKEVITLSASPRSLESLNMLIGGATQALCFYFISSAVKTIVLKIISVVEKKNEDK